MAGTTGGSGSGGGRRFRGDRSAVGTVEQAERRGAVKRARVSAGASRSGVSSSVREVFRFVLMKYVMEAAKNYVKQELLTESARNEIVQKVVEKIIGHHQEQIPETEKAMEQYVSQNEKQIKDCLKGYVETFWYSMA